jgi:hypothetical protein
VLRDKENQNPESRSQEKAKTQNAEKAKHIRNDNNTYISKL